MGIFDLYSKRQKRLSGDVPDVYVYVIPSQLKTQIVHIWNDALGSPAEYWRASVVGAYEYIVKTLCREYGLFSLSGGRNYAGRNYQDELVNYFLAESRTDKLLDVVELSFLVIDKATREWSYLDRRNANSIAEAAISELNGRFRECGVGFQFHDGEIIRIDSELIHSEVVKPALRLLNQRKYEGVQEEFLKAHEHYRNGHAKESLNECLKAFESLMKSICDERGWDYPGNATAKNLIQICFDNGLIPAFWQQSFNSLRSLLESSIPTGRNRLGGHGQGASTTEVPDHLVAYMLHMTASALVFLDAANCSPTHC